MSFYSCFVKVCRVSGSSIKQKRVSAPLSAAMLLLSVCFLSGCGGGSGKSVPSGTANGTVKVKGTALTECRINFVSSTTGTGIYADLQADGSYELPSAIPVGDYRVYFTSPGLGDAPPPASGNPELNDALKNVPRMYQSEQATDLQAMVKEGSNTFDFDLKP
tara:strand:- start:2945 stop:3430 length:486 start_codon:yes stop_codon:yes gene_type:complete